MRRTKPLLTLLGLVFLVNASGQHSPLTSQYLFNGLVINPAYAGSRDAMAINLTHRQQWVGFEGAPVTQTLSIHSPVAKRKIGLGLMILNDRIGVSQQTGVFTSYAYRIRTAKGKLSLGLGAGATLLRANWTDVALQQPNDQVFSADTQHGLRPNFSAGTYYYTKTWFFGASLPFVLLHQYNPEASGYVLREAELDAQPMLTGGALFVLTRSMKLKPSTLLRYRPESGLQMDLSANLILQDKVWFGASYRSGDAVSGSINVLPTAQWRLGYAYDLGVSALRTYHHGTHELMVQYEFGYRIRVKDPRYF
jgi:type IX secretion system PorP/SprF family membrane protein